MIEHRLIERMINQVKQELSKIEATNRVDTSFIAAAADFFRMYADRCHHGKEEDILFKELADKPLSLEHRAMMDELIHEHVLARETVGKLTGARERYERNDAAALKDIMESMSFLTRLYPAHIEKEDKRFFLPSMEYFSEQEKDEMLKAFWEFDRGLIHEVYRNKVIQLEQAQS
jgi:hemerythrin-like domain-containing protein